MPKKRFVLDTMPPRLLEIAWKGGWFRVESDIVIRCDGIMVGSNLQPDDLFTGHDIVVADGTPLTVRLVDHRIQVFSNEARLVEKESQWASVMLFGSGLISLVIGLLAIILGIEPFATPLRYPSSIAWITVLTQFMHDGYGYVLLGILVIAIAWRNTRRRNEKILAIFLPLMIVYGVIDDVIIDSQQNGHPNLVGVILWLGLACFGLAIFVKTISGRKIVSKGVWSKRCACSARRCFQRAALPDQRFRSGGD